VKDVAAVARRDVDDDASLRVLGGNRAGLAVDFLDQRIVVIEVDVVVPHHAVHDDAVDDRVRGQIDALPDEEPGSANVTVYAPGRRSTRIQALGVGDHGRHLLNQRRARGLDRHTGHDGAARVLDLARDGTLCGGQRRQARQHDEQEKHSHSMPAQKSFFLPSRRAMGNRVAARGMKSRSSLAAPFRLVN